MLQKDADKLVKNSEEIYQLNVKLGWYENPPIDDIKIFLIRSEVFELFEAWRKEKYADINWLNNKKDIDKDWYFKKLFEDRVKDTVQDEVADIYIRIMDFIGYKKMSFDVDKDIVHGINVCAKPFQTIEQLDSILYKMANSVGDGVTAHRINNCKNE